jgi:hypothetical protein
MNLFFSTVAPSDPFTGEGWSGGSRRTLTSPIVVNVTKKALLQLQQLQHFQHLIGTIQKAAFRLRRTGTDDCDDICDISRLNPQTRMDITDISVIKMPPPPIEWLE